MSVLAMSSGYKRDRDVRLMSAVQEVRLVGEIAKTVRPLSAEVFFGFCGLKWNVMCSSVKLILVGYFNARAAPLQNSSCVVIVLCG